MPSGMSLHPEKTRIVDYGAGESFEFLGYEFRKGFVYPKRKSYQNTAEQGPRPNSSTLRAQP